MDLKNKEIVKLSIWVISLLLILEAGFSMINASCTVFNILGILLFIAFITVSIRTKCLINFNLKKNKCLINLKNKKNEKID